MCVDHVLIGSLVGASVLHSPRVTLWDWLRLRNLRGFVNALNTTHLQMSLGAWARNPGGVFYPDSSLTLLMNHVIKCLKIINYTF